jgi:hypothetical protein
MNKETRPNGRRAGCPVCHHIERRLTDVGLAIGHSPRWLARRTNNLRAHQIKAHLKGSLGGNAFFHIVRERNCTDVLEAAEKEAIGDAV